MTTQVKATEQYFPVVLFVMLYKVVLTSVSVEKTVKCNFSNDSSQISCPALCAFVKYA